jgi:CAAX protease family protein
MSDFGSRMQFLTLAGLFEGGLLFLALGLGWVAAIDPLADLRFEPIDAAWGVLAGVSLFGLLLLSERLPLAGMRRIRGLLVEYLGRPLSECRWYDLLLLAALVGLSEEALFRGLIQPWIERSFGRTQGLIWSNVLFGIVHAVTPAYAVLAGLIGAFLGWLLDATGARSLLVPAVTHAVYDYLAFLWIVRLHRRQRPPGLDGEPDIETNGFAV